MAKKQLLEDMCTEPTRFFRAPGDVLRDRRFGGTQKARNPYGLGTNSGAANTEDHDIVVLNAVRAARDEVERRRAGSQNLGNGTTN